MCAEPLAVAPPVELGESPLWDAEAQRLMWVDILGCRVHAYLPSTGEDVSVPVDDAPAALALTEDGTYLLTLGLEVVRIGWPVLASQPLGRLARGVRANDGAVDPQGRFLVGTLVEESAPGGAEVYRLEDGSVQTVATGVTISNGLDWSPDGATMYYVDTPLEQIDAFDYSAETGALSRRRVFADLHDVPGRPDGLTVDAEGGVWVAMARGGGAVRRFTPDGRPDMIISLPVPHPTSLAFGGAGLDELYITTSQLRMDPDDLRRWPAAGSLFVVRDTGFTGRLAYRYR